MLDRVLRKCEIESGRAHIGDELVDLSHLNDVPLLTVEAHMDEMIGQGQTHAAQKITANHNALSNRLTIDGGHESLFSGKAFQKEVAPLLTGFIERVAKS